jgi:hypothetical protein
VIKCTSSSSQQEVDLSIFIKRKRLFTSARHTYIYEHGGERERKQRTTNERTVTVRQNKMQKMCTLKKNGMITEPKKVS